MPDGAVRFGGDMFDDDMFDERATLGQTVLGEVGMDENDTGDQEFGGDGYGDDAIDATDATDARQAAHLLAPGPARPLLEVVAPVVESLGFQLLRIRMTGDDGKMILQVMAENDEAGLTIEQCEAISHALSDVLDVENPISGTYALEVSSPGVARPLTRAVDFERWSGYEAKLGLKMAVDGQRRFRGRVEGFADGEARLEVQVDGFDTPQILGFALDDISEARLVPDEAELKASLRAAKGK